MVVVVDVFFMLFSFFLVIKFGEIEGDSYNFQVERFTWISFGG